MSEGECARVCVRASDGGLETALARTLMHAFGESVVLLCDPRSDCTGNILVTTDRVTSPAEVVDKVAHGIQVVVLAALPSEVAEANYVTAGASAYLPMFAAVAPLVAAVGALLTAAAV